MWIRFPFFSYFEENIKQAVPNEYCCPSFISDARTKLTGCMDRMRYPTDWRVQYVAFVCYFFWFIITWSLSLIKINSFCFFVVAVVVLHLQSSSHVFAFSFSYYYFCNTEHSVSRGEKNKTLQSYCIHTGFQNISTRFGISCAYVVLIHDRFLFFCSFQVLFTVVLFNIYCVYFLMISCSLPAPIWTCTSDANRKRLDHLALFLFFLYEI